MPLKKYSENDADLSALGNKKIAVIGYGSQGDAQANCLKDSGLDVIVGLRKGKSWNKAVRDGHRVFDVEEAARAADIIHMLIPDEVQQDVYETYIKKNLRRGKTLSFSHGFNIVYGLINPPKDVNIIMVAPLGPGAEVRRMFLDNSGVPCLIAVKQDNGEGKEIALAVAKGCGFLRNGAFECSFEQETHQDLFSEQVVLCGGIVELAKAAYDILAEKGYPKELAYFCLHETKLITNLLAEHGIEGMYSRVSNTAEYGGRVVGRKIIDGAVRQKMKEVLGDIVDGKFAEEWINEFKKGLPSLSDMREKGKRESIEKIGKEIRERMH